MKHSTTKEASETIHCRWCPFSCPTKPGMVCHERLKHAEEFYGERAKANRKADEALVQRRAKIAQIRGADKKLDAAAKVEAGDEVTKLIHRMYLRKNELNSKITALEELISEREKVETEIAVLELALSQIKHPEEHAEQAPWEEQDLHLPYSIQCDQGFHDECKQDDCTCQCHSEQDGKTA